MKELDLQNLIRIELGKNAKHCFRCKKVFPVSAFSPRKGGLLRCDTLCRPCRAAYKRKWYRDHRESEVARSMAWNTENYERFLINNRRSQNTHKARRNKSARMARAANPELFRNRERAYKRTPASKRARLLWIANNPDRVAFQNSQKQNRRRARQGGWHEIKMCDWMAIKESYGQRCVYCGKRKRLTMDHFVPLAKGGAHNKSNIVPACLPCNVRKKDKLPEEFMALILAEAL